MDIDLYESTILEPVIRSFYIRVMNDTREFSKPFHRVDLEHHVREQVNFLVSIIKGDVDRYPKGYIKLYHMHKIFASNFMNEENSQIWMEHMIKAIDENNISRQVKRELINIFKEEMVKYGHQFNFEFTNKSRL